MTAVIPLLVALAVGSPDLERGAAIGPAAPPASAASPASAAPPASGGPPAPTSRTARGHGPQAPADRFGHVFRVAAHAPSRPQLSFHFGLIQPILLRGFNAAVDFRFRRFIATYSHGQGLEIDRAPGVLSDAERAAGVEAFEPFTTGFGVGAVIIDELYVLADFKVHGFDVRYGAQSSRYTTFTIGGEIGWRLFLWKGLHIAPVVRYWPTVYSSLEDRRLVLDPERNIVHRSIPQGMRGLFFNVLLGWSFGL